MGSEMCIRDRSLVAFVVRFAWMWVLCKVNQRKGRTNVSPLRLQEVLLMAWSGMRGLVTLALVLSIPPEATPYHHELSVIALTVLTCTMVIPGLLLPWLVGKLDLQSGPDADADKAYEELNQRAYAAARKAVQDHGEEFAPEAYTMVQEWFDSIAERRMQDPEGSKERKEQFLRARAGAAKMQEIALRAASRELQRARRERTYNPADVDAVLADLDKLIMARERGALASPSQMVKWDGES